MTEKQIQIIQDSYGRLYEDRNAAESFFLFRFLEKNPELKSVFLDDFITEGRKLFSALNVYVRNLDHSEIYHSMVSELVFRINQCEINHTYFDSGWKCLLVVMELMLGDEYETETEEAWVALYSIFKRELENF